MFDLIPDLAPASARRPHDVFGAHTAFRGGCFLGRRNDLQSGDLLLRALEIDVAQELSEQIVGSPRDGVAATELVAQVAHESDGKIRLRLGNSHFDFQFLDTAFHVRPFASVVGFGSHLDPAPNAKGRPVAAGAV